MSDAPKSTINFNLVGFDQGAAERFKKQLETINTMNTSQKQLKCIWGVGTSINSCKVHFVISSPIPAYLEHSKDPILTNQHSSNENVIPCPYPVTTFDLMDILAYVETVIAIAIEQKKTVANTPIDLNAYTADKIETPPETQSLSLYERAQLGLNSKNQASNNNLDSNDKKEHHVSIAATLTATSTPVDDNPSSANNTNKDTNAANKEEFTYYNVNKIDIKKDAETPVKEETVKVQESEVSNTSAVNKINTPDEPASSRTDHAHESTVLTGATDPEQHTEANTATKVEQPKSFLDALLESRKNKTGSSSTHTSNDKDSETAQTSYTKNYAKTILESKQTTRKEDAKASVLTHKSNQVEEKASTQTPTAPMTDDAWLEILNTETGIIHYQTPDIYLDLESKIVACHSAKISELVSLLPKQKQINHNAPNAIPNELKTFPLSSVLWSYGLHHPNADALLQDMDLENQEWKLKGFPRFGQWETHPTWLFLATFFAQSHRSVYSAEATGKASKEQIKQFICAAKLVGLSWNGRALSEDVKQQQLSHLNAQQPHTNAASSWISRLRDKLHINKHFENKHFES